MSHKYIELHGQVNANDANQRLDHVLSKMFPQYSRAQLQQWIKQGHVTLDGNPCTKQRQKVVAEQRIHINAPLTPKEVWTAQAIPLNVIYEDQAILIINKPIHCVVHPGAGNPDNTLVNALLNYAPELAAVPRAGVIHRLDKDTSGLLIIARDLTAHHQLIKLMKDRLIQRKYFAIVKGHIIAGGSVDAPIGRHPQIRTRMAVTPQGKAAITHYRVLEHFTAHTYLDVQLETGRTHQIRVHMQHIKHPIVGDPVYGKLGPESKQCSPALREALAAFTRQALHAYQLNFDHPLENKPMQFRVEPPDDMQQLLQALREDANGAS